MGTTLTKMNIIRALAEKQEMEIAATRRVVQGTFDMITQALIQGRKIELRNFGIFEIIERKGRIARNPKSREEVFIPPHKVVKFRPGRIMEQQITEPSMKGGIQPAPRRVPKDESPRVSGEVDSQ